MWELDHKETWAPKNRCFWTVVLEKILESPLDCKEIKPVNPKGNQFWIFIVRTEAEAEVLILGHLMRRVILLEKTVMLGKIEGKREGCDKGLDGWILSLNQWTWVWANSRRRWSTGNSDVLQFMGSQRVRHDLVTEQQQQQQIFRINSLNSTNNSSFRWRPIINNLFSFQYPEWKPALFNCIFFDVVS